MLVHAISFTTYVYNLLETYRAQAGIIKLSHCDQYNKFAGSMERICKYQHNN